MSNQSQKIGEQAAKIEALERELTDFRGEVKRIFDKLEEIHGSLAVLKAAPACADPSACKRMEGALVDQNKRLVRLELERQRLLGERTAIGVVCSAIGVGVGWLLEIFHK
jgi:chromosome segregation ATPase